VQALACLIVNLSRSFRNICLVEVTVAFLNENRFDLNNLNILDVGYIKRNASKNGESKASVYFIS
jgi:hypothetical protein